MLGPVNTQIVLTGPSRAFFVYYEYTSIFMMILATKGSNCVSIVEGN